MVRSDKAAAIIDGHESHASFEYHCGSASRASFTVQAARRVHNEEDTALLDGLSQDNQILVVVHSALKVAHDFQVSGPNRSSVFFGLEDIHVVSGGNHGGEIRPVASFVPFWQQSCRLQIATVEDRVHREVASILCRRSYDPRLSIRLFGLPPEESQSHPISS